MCECEEQTEVFEIQVMVVRLQMETWEAPRILSSTLLWKGHLLKAPIHAIA